MPLSHIEHFLVAADDIDATRDWYARVLGMKPGPHPDFGFRCTGCTSARPTSCTSAERESGRRDPEEIPRPHLAGRRGRHRRARPHRFSRNRAALDAGALEKGEGPFSQRRANGQALFQLFLHDPNGIKIELNFAAQEAAGLEPELMASDLIRS